MRERIICLENVADFGWDSERAWAWARIFLPFEC